MESKPTKRQPKIRKVNGYIVYFDEIIGSGQFGRVVKAQMINELQERKNDQGQQIHRSKSDPRVRCFACKIFDCVNFSEEQV